MPEGRSRPGSLDLKQLRRHGPERGKPDGSSARDKLIVALDVPNAGAAAGIAERLRSHVEMFKVGSELFTAEGPALVRRLVASGAKVFLDLKYHDIPNTVRAAAREAARLGISMMDVHASGGSRMMEAAIEGASEAIVAQQPGGSRPLVLAVTVLTSLAGEDLEELGIAGQPKEVVVRMARLAQRAGLDGVVASAQEVARLRRACGPRFVIVTPGIRPAATASNDQARVSTPQAAIKAGADFLVVGRPIIEAADPVAAAAAIVREIQAAPRASVVGGRGSGIRQ